MKKHLTLFSGFLFIIMVLCCLPSCKKGDGDPFISLLSRKARLSGEWKVSNLAIIYQYANKVRETTYDGITKKVVYKVADTNINGSTTTYIKNWSFSGDIITDFEKNGTYYYQETFKDDSSGLTVTIEKNGMWYFMGPNQDNGYKDKELLALQVNQYSYNPSVGQDHLTIFQGENSVEVYEIYGLKNKEVTLKINKVETIGFVDYTTTLMMVLEPR